MVLPLTPEEAAAYDSWREKKSEHQREWREKKQAADLPMAVNHESKGAV